MNATDASAPRPRSNGDGCTAGCIIFVIIVAVAFVGINGEWKQANRRPKSSVDPRLSDYTKGMLSEPTVEERLNSFLEAAGLEATAVRITRDRRWYDSRNSVTIYVSKPDFEKIPFPDRPEFVKQAAAIWCKGVEQKSFFTRVTFSDIANGSELAAERCSAQFSPPN